MKIKLQYEQKGQKRSAAGKLISLGGEYVVLENEGNNFAVPLEGIYDMQVLELPLRIHFASETSLPNDKADKKLGMGLSS